MTSQEIQMVKLALTNEWERPQIISKRCGLSLQKTCGILRTALKNEIEISSIKINKYNLNVYKKIS